MTDTSALRAFIEARLADDDRREPDAFNDRFVGDAPAWLLDRIGPATRRASREVAAKRAILAEHTRTETIDFEGRVSTGSWCPLCRNDGECPTLGALASVWSDHPDHRPEWSTA